MGSGNGGKPGVENPRRESWGDVLQDKGVRTCLTSVGLIVLFALLAAGWAVCLRFDLPSGCSVGLLIAAGGLLLLASILVRPRSH